MLFFQSVFLCLRDLIRLLQHIESIYYHFYWYNILLLFCFLSNQENLNMIHHIFCSHLKNYFITSSGWLFIMSSILTLFEYITHSLLLSSLQEIKLLFIGNWIFQVLDFLRSSMISFKYGLVLLRYSSTDSVFLLPLFLYSI